MSSKHYEDQLLNAIETMVNNAVSQAEYDRTIRATISSCLDATAGKYRIKYQDSYFDAWSNNLDILYADGTQVYILVPKNDMSQTKMILHAVDKNTIEYTADVEEIESYELISNNMLTDNNYSLCSYDGETIITLYDRDSKINLINYDENSFVTSLQEAEGFCFGADFKTNLPKEQRKKGNYGINFDIDFKNNSTDTIVTKSYTLNINNMRGNPYYLTEATSQIVNFEIETENYISIKNITIFAKNFPNTELSKPKDIFISNFQLYATRMMPEGYSLKIKMDKSYFSKEDNRSKEIKVTGLTYLDGKEIKKKFSYYWFRQNNNITIESDKYVQYAGEGWECLNKKIMTDSQTNTYEYVTTSNSYSFPKYSCLAVENDFKLVAVLNDLVISKTFVIKNYSSDYIITIESDGGDTFYYDNGLPTLTAYVNGLEDTSHFYYVWSRVDNNKQFTTLAETTNYNQEYKLAVTGYETLQSRIAAEEIMPRSCEYELEDYLTTIKKYNTIQRVEKNKIHHVNISSIDQYATYMCSVFNTSKILVGSASIILYNKMVLEGDYHLSIENGNQTFNYDENGYSPAISWLDKPVELKPLKLVLRDNKGNIFADNILESCKIKWTIPENSLIIAKDSGSPVLKYDLEYLYDVTKIGNNDIQVELTYKDATYYAQTNFTFVKDGEPGTNGTGIICKIVPNTDTPITEYPMLINGQLNFNPQITNKWFKVQLWRNGSMIWEGTDTVINDQYDEEKNIYVTWSNLMNRYSEYVTDAHSFSITSNAFTYNSYQADGADIVKVEVEYDGKQYYSALPLIVLDLKNNDYQVKLEKGSGFRYVKYTNNGEDPKYDNVSPFTVNVQQMINGYWEDISTITNQYQLTYNWTVRGRVYNGTSWDDVPGMWGISQNQNTATYWPNEKYDGQIVNNALQVEIRKGNTLIANLHIPIYFYLDRFGISAINDWDGNSINLRQNEGMILSPQAGFGKKENDNSFTGLLMGAVQEKPDNEIEEGIIGYYQGQRTLFIDAKTGKAIFGKTGQGQVIIDPSTNEALIYGGNFSTSAGTGMKIDLTKPEIEWGSGNFTVDQNGIIHGAKVEVTGILVADESSKLGPWTASKTSMWYGSNTFGGANSLYFGTQGLSLSNHFQVSSDGYLTLKTELRRFWNSWYSYSW